MHKWACAPADQSRRASAAYIFFALVQFVLVHSNIQGSTVAVLLSPTSLGGGGGRQFGSVPGGLLVVSWSSAGVLVSFS